MSLACIVVSLLCYGLYYYNTIRILENRLKDQTRTQLAMSEQSITECFENLSTASYSLMNTLDQYAFSSSADYCTTLNQLDNIYDAEAIRFANYTISTFDTYLEHYPSLNSISVYTRGGTTISSSGQYTKFQVLSPENSDFIMNSIIPEYNLENAYFTWLGNYKIQNFVLGYHQLPDSEDAADSVITGIRRIGNYKNEQNDIFLVFNVNETAIRDIYGNSPLISDSGSAYLTDANGTVLSSTDPQAIGTLSPYAEQLTQKGEFFSFKETLNGQQQYLFYRSLDGLNWFLIYEVPVSSYSSDMSSFQKITCLFFLLTLGTMLLIVLFVIIRKLKPIHELTQAVTYVGKGNLGYTIHIQEENEIGILAQNFNRMSLDLQQIMMEKEQMAEQKRHQEIAALQAQINPHFILNTINTVKWMAILSQAPNISECLISFGKLLEPLLKQQTDFYTVEEEISYLENYIDVMNYSYGNTIHMSLSIPEKLKKCQIPRFILQPLVENAVLHGVDKATNKVLIEIILSTNGDILCLAVFSQGTAIAPDHLLSIQNGLISMSPIPGSRTSSIGLTNVTQRIQTFYGESYGLWIENSSDCQVKVTVTLPLSYLS